MKAEPKNFEKFLKETDTQFIIPVYQRNYDWKIFHCKQLFDDIIKAGNPDIKSHFIGSIVFITDSEYQTGNINELVIIDGQQRITTFTLLWLAILEKATEFNNERLIKTILKKYIINEDFDDKEKLKLRPTANNNKILQGIIKEGQNFEYDEFSNLIENYSFFLKSITQENFDLLLIGIRKLLFVEMSLTRDVDDPQRIFESLNATGLDLSEADKIRNYILIDLSPKIQEDFYNNYWQEIERNAKILNTNQDKVDEFIRDYLTLSFKEISNKNKVYQTFKERFNFQNNQEKENELIKLKKYSKHYNKLLNPQKETDTDIKKELELIQLLEITVAYPFLLQIYQDFNNSSIDKKEFIKILKIIQSFVFRRFVLDLRTAALNKIFKNLYSDIIKTSNDKFNFIETLEFELRRKTRSQRFPNNEEIKNELKFKDFYNVTPKKRKYLLLQLENFEHKEPINITDYTIEHIFPQNPDKEWQLKLNQLEYTKMQDKYLNTISNLTLTAYNSEYSNKVFQIKRDMEKGFKESHLFLNKYIANCEKWNTETLNERFEVIYQRFCKIWEFPELEITASDTIDEQNLFEISDPTGKKAEYIIFYKEKIPVKTNKEILEIVGRKMFNLEPKSFVGTKLGEILKLSTKKEDDRKYSKISDKYFIYTWHSSKEILNKIELILTEFEWYNELYIKFKEPDTEIE